MRTLVRIATCYFAMTFMLPAVVSLGIHWTAPGNSTQQLPDMILAQHEKATLASTKLTATAFT